MHPDELAKLPLVALRNLLLQEMKEFIAALDNETYQQLQERKDRINLIDGEIDKRQNSKKQYQKA